jgi:hypothetical protein
MAPNNHIKAIVLTIISRKIVLFWIKNAIKTTLIYEAEIM